MFGTGTTCTVISAIGFGAFLGVVGLTFWNKSWKRVQNKNRKRPWSTVAKLYHTPSFLSSRCTWMVEELGVGKHFEIQPYNPYFASEQEVEWYKTHINPSGKVPGLQVGDKVLTESAAICLYLAEVYDALHPPPGMESVYYNWIVHAVVVLDPICRTLYRQIQKTENDKQDVQSITESLKIYAQFINNLNKHMETNDFVCGKTFTTADIVLGYNVMCVSVIKGGMLLMDYTNVKDYLRRLKERKAFQAGMGSSREWLNVPQWETPSETAGEAE